MPTSPPTPRNVEAEESFYWYSSRPSPIDPEPVPVATEPVASPAESAAPSEEIASTPVEEGLETGGGYTLLLHRSSTLQYEGQRDALTPMTLQRGRPGDVAGVLAKLVIPPTAPEPANKGFKLHYLTLVERDMALSLLPYLDIAPVGDNGVPADDGEGASDGAAAAARRGLGLLYSTQLALDAPSDTLRESARLLALVADVPTEEESLRWMAAMLCGMIHVQWLGEPEKAVGFFAMAEERALPGSYAQGVALLYQARTRLGQARRAEGSRLLSRVVSEFSIYRDTAMYERALEGFARANR